MPIEDNAMGGPGSGDTGPDRVKIISPGRFPATRENGHRGTNGANAISGIWQRRAFGFHCVAT